MKSLWALAGCVRHFLKISDILKSNWQISRWYLLVAPHRSWMSLSCMVCCSWTVARSFLRCSHCCVTWLSFISCSSLLWLLISSDHSLVCAAVMSFTCTHVTGTQQRYLSSSRLTALWKRMQVLQLEVICYLDFVISTQCLYFILRLLLELLAVVFPVRKI